MTIGDRIKAQRQRRRFTQDELARRAGLTQAHVSQLEAGARENPQANVVLALARALDCSTDYLLGMYELTEKERVS
jgi:transcriptional regulator with XRE-family HTH domain